MALLVREATVVPVILSHFSKVIYPVAVHEVETVTLQVAENPPSVVVTVIAVVPEATPVTTPEGDTEAIPVFPEVHVTLLFVALVGSTVAERREVEPTLSVKLAGLTDTLVTGTLFTVTSQYAVKPPSDEVVVIMAVPADNPVTTPEVLTVATLPLEVLQA